MLLCKGAKVSDSFRVVGGGRQWALYVVTRSRPYPLHRMPCQLANGSTDQLVTPLVPVSPCPRAPSLTRLPRVRLLLLHAAGELDEELDLLLHDGEVDDFAGGVHIA